jgi:hypothetical protein
MEYFHLNHRPVDFFVGRLQTRLRQSSSAKLRGRFAQWESDVHGEAALAVVAKIEMLNRAMAWLDADVAKLVEYLDSAPAVVEQCIRERRAPTIAKLDLWRLCLGIETFLFEARSTYQIPGKFLDGFFRLVFRRRITETEVVSAVSARGGDVTWIPLLKENRDWFAHSAASWLAVERTQANPPQFDLLLLKRNVENLTEDDFVRFGDCQAVGRGLATSVNRIVRWIEDEIVKIEREDPAEKGE